MSSRIRQIFESKDLTSAIAWYQDHGENSFLKVLLQSNPSENSINQLWSEIESRLDPDDQLVDDFFLQKEATQIEIPAEVPPDREQSDQNSSPGLNELHFRRKENFKMIKHWRNKLFSSDFETRKEAAFKVLYHAQKNKEAWIDIHFFEENGYLPVSHFKELKDFSVPDLIHQLKLDQNYVYKHSAKVKKYDQVADKESISKYEGRILERQARIIQITKLLEDVST